MQVFCPKCRGLIEAAADLNSDACTCPACGSSFTVDAAATLPADAATCGANGSEPVLVERTTIGRFQIDCEIGHGSNGTVLKAYDPQLQRTVALKVPRRGHARTAHERERFQREARHASQLHHPAIVPIFDLGECDGLAYIVSEFVEGSTLAALLPDHKFSFRQAAELVASVADGLQCAHESGVVHRDIKPSNIIVDLQGRPRIMDFGIARQAQADATLTLEGEVLGTPAYMSPEQAAGKSHEVDKRSDVYSLGVILYELLAGERPFRGTTPMVIHQVLRDDPRNLRGLNDDIPADLETICLKAMEKEPEHRYQAARDFAQDLRRWLRSEPILARRVGPLGRAARWCRRNPSLAAMTAVALVLLVSVAAGATAAVMWISSSHQREREARAAAGGSAKEARRAFEQYYALISENPLLDDPASQPFLREILQSAIEQCRRFLSQYGDQPNLAAEVAATYVRLAQLQLASGESDQATATMETAADRLESLLAGRPTFEQVRPLSIGLFRYPRYILRRGAINPTNPGRSVALMHRSVAIWDRLVADNPGVPNFDRDRAGMNYYLEISCRAAHDTPGAIRSIEKAIEIMTRLLQQEPGNRLYRRDLSQFYTAAGDLYLATGDQPGGIRAHERSVAADPSNPFPYTRMAWRLANDRDVRLRDLPRAVELAKKAVAIAPRNPNSWHALGAAQFRVGQWQAALDSFDKTMMLANGGDGVDWYFAAMAAWKLGDKDRARGFFDKAQKWKEGNRIPPDYLEGIDREAADLLISLKNHPGAADAQAAPGATLSR